MTVAVNDCVPPAPIVAEEGDTETPTGGGVTVMVDEATLVVSVTEDAVIVAAAGLGTVAGAV